MTAIRIGAFLMLAAFGAAQSSPPSKIIGPPAPEPQLPVVQRDACPHVVVSDVKLAKEVRMYSSWQDKRAFLGTLRAGDKVTVLSGINIIREPDKALVTQPFVQPSLKPGEVILRYGIDYDDNWNFWAKGTWFAENYAQVVEKDASCNWPDQRACHVKIVEYGIKEWWLQVKTRSGSTGWALANKYTDITEMGGTPFVGACADSEDNGD
jgi:hypothetical protein